MQVPCGALASERIHHRNKDRIEKAYCGADRRHYIDGTVTELLASPAALIADMHSEGIAELDSALKRLCNASTFSQMLDAQCDLNDLMRVWAGKYAELAADKIYPR